jgi:hypothetical protein
MALSDEEKKETKQLMAEAFAEGLALFRSKAEEEAAKNNPPVEPPKEKGKTGDDSNSFSLAGFLLGR